MKLKVGLAAADEVYRDFARLNEEIRLDKDGLKINEGQVFKLVSGGKKAYVIARGNKEGGKYIYLDERTRNILGVDAGDEHEFELVRVHSLGQFFWAWNASDPAYRIAARLSVFSFSLGLLGLLLGIISIVIALVS